MSLLLGVCSSTGSQILLRVTYAKFSQGNLAKCKGTSPENPQLSPTISLARTRLGAELQQIVAEQLLQRR